MFSNAQAMKITAETYPVAVACLDPFFALEAEERAYGYYLLINELQPVSDEDGNANFLGLSNRLVPVEEFRQMYQFTTGERKERFSSVTKFRSREDIIREKYLADAKRMREERQARVSQVSKKVG